jgi:5'-3' exonuclease
VLALIDGDIVLYRSGWSSENDPEAIACARANETIEGILRDVQATEFQVWLSDSLENNFRFRIDPQYKISRQGQPKPKHYQALKYFLKKEWNAQVTEGQEADDALGIEQSANNEWVHDANGGKRAGESTICSIDKDLLQVPGQHYNFVRKERLTVTEDEGIRFFYKQLVIGDRIDDIIGVKGIGPVKAGRLLDSCPNSELFNKVRYAYNDDARLLRNGQLLWIRREPEQVWKFPETSEESIVQDESGESSDPFDGYSIGEEAPSGVLL